MTADSASNVHWDEATAMSGHESQQLLSRNSAEDGSAGEDDDLIIHPGPSTSPSLPHDKPHGRTSADNEASREPTTAPKAQNRVRFDIADDGDDLEADTHGNGRQSHEWLNEEDYLDDDEGSGGGRRQSDSRHRVPLLTDIEAPSVTVATTSDLLNDERLDDESRPKSGIGPAFMNMANSIIGAGIIGQPYAFREAGMMTGILLLVGLTWVIDWTIRLIVVNSKLSGADSFQTTVERCFGRPGLIAISLAQWAFAFGGMVAF
ncbi:hypothetical protein KEM55_006533, partial [Ascosphaera atra]